MQRCESGIDGTAAHYGVDLDDSTDGGAATIDACPFPESCRNCSPGTSALTTGNLLNDSLFLVPGETVTMARPRASIVGAVLAIRRRFWICISVA